LPRSSTNRASPHEQRLSAHRVTAVLSSVKVLAESISTLPLMVLERHASGDKRPATELPLSPILHALCNDEATAQSVRETLHRPEPKRDLDVGGRRSSERGRVEALGPDAQRSAAEVDHRAHAPARSPVREVEATPAGQDVGDVAALDDAIDHGDVADTDGDRDAAGIVRDRARRVRDERLEPQSPLASQRDPGAPHEEEVRLRRRGARRRERRKDQRETEQDADRGLHGCESTKPCDAYAAAGAAALLAAERDASAVLRHYLLLAMELCTRRTGDAGLRTKLLAEPKEGDVNRATAADCLGRVGGRAAAQALLRAFRAEKDNASLRPCLARALGLLLDRTEGRRLNRILQHRNWRLTTEATEEIVLLVD
jgi:hypothetical protein